MPDIVIFKFDKDVFAMGNYFRTKSNQIVQVHIRKQCTMVLINSVSTTYQGNEILIVDN